MKFTKREKADLDSPRQEFSNGGLGIVAALLVHWQIDFPCASTGGPSNPAVLFLVTKKCCCKNLLYLTYSTYLTKSELP